MNSGIIFTVIPYDRVNKCQRRARRITETIKEIIANTIPAGSMFFKILMICGISVI